MLLYHLRLAPPLWRVGDGVGGGLQLAVARVCVHGQRQGSSRQRWSSGRAGSRGAKGKQLPLQDRREGEV